MIVAMSLIYSIAPPVLVLKAVLSRLQDSSSNGSDTSSEEGASGDGVGSTSVGGGLSGGVGGLGSYWNCQLLGSIYTEQSIVKRTYPGADHRRSG